MIKDVLGKLFGRRPDPTVDWPSTKLPPIVLEVDRGSIGPVAIGAALEDARALGKPDASERSGATSLSLRYPGILTEFDSGRLVYIGLLLVPDGTVNVAALPRLALSCGRAFSAATTEHEVRQSLGEPEDIDCDSNETVLRFRRGSIDIEAEFVPSGTLRRINLIRVPPE